MRPVELAVEGFSCFREPQAVLDFRSLTLFAITGPTGAGKSSVLDAMMYALYCKVPRLGKSGVTELISQLRDQMSVRFDFELGGRRYRVARRTRRRGAASAMLVEVVDGTERPIADGVRDVNQRIEALLGLSYEAFQQAVLLPQGQFDQFLRSDPGDRRDILRALLRLEVYERMREQAHERARSLATEIATATRRLDEDFASVTAASIEALRREVAAADADLEARSEALGKAEAEVGRLTPLFAATRERCDVGVRLARLAANDADVLAQKRRIERSHAASAVMPSIDIATKSGARATAEAERAATARNAAEQLTATAADATRLLEQARTAHDGVPALQDRLRVLDGLSGVISHRDALAGRVRKLEQDLAAAAKALAERRHACETLASQVTEAERVHRARADALAAISYDATRHSALEGCRDTAVAVAQLRKMGADQQAAVTKASKAAREAEAKATRARAGAERARALLDEVVGRHDAACRAYEVARNEHAALHLRGTLQPGAACPVCEQVVREVPAGIAAPALDAARGEAERLEQERATAQQACTEADTQVATCAAVATRCADEQRAAAEKCAAIQAELASAVERLAASLASTGIGSAPVRLEGDTTTVGAPASDGRLPEVFVTETLAALAIARKQHDEADGKARVAERALSDVQQKLELATQEVAAGTTRGADIESALAADRDELQQVAARVLEVCPSGDPASERASVATQVAQLVRDLQAATSAHHDAERRLEAARTAATEAHRVATEATSAAERDRAMAMQSLTDAGFADAAEARTALLSDKELKALLERVTTHERERALLQDRTAALSAQLVDGEVSAHQMSAVEAAAADAKTARDNAVTRAATLEHKLQTDEQRLATATRLRVERERHQAEHAVVDRLATDLKSDGFQEYLLQEVFERLVRDASVRLQQLTNRYTLEWDDGDFVVVDHDNAGERRAAQTLSGGETFLTSLSLALALSEQVQRTAGAVGLDSLFIDEGFGTLDADTLDVATEAIESLQVGGRMVGIISHIKELTERMPACIVIDKRPDGSRWRVTRT